MAPEDGSSAYSVAELSSIAHTAPAATIGDPVCTWRARHVTAMLAGDTDTAVSPSRHGRNTVESSHEVPPHAPEHTPLAASGLPTPPRPEVRRTEATPCLPTATRTPEAGRRVTPTEPRSLSVASKYRQLEGAK